MRSTGAGRGRRAMKEGPWTLLGSASLPGKRGRLPVQFCQISVWSTPRVPENEARKIRRAVDGCVYAGRPKAGKP